MKTPSALLLTLLTASFILHPSSFLLAQGPLTPPGAPAPTMKTLDQLEARTPISSAPFVLGASGSYYLTGNLTVATGTAITIAADNVTLDLNGFTISSTASPAAGNAVTITGVRRNVTVRNGHIRGTTTFAAGTFTPGGFLDGVSTSSASPSSDNLRVSEVSVSGVGSDGIFLAFSDVPTLVIERCAVSVCAGAGITGGLVRDCAVNVSGTFGIVGGTVTDSYAESVGATGADDAINCVLAENCRGVAAAGKGIEAGTASNCHGTSVSANGVSVVMASNSTGVSTSGVGLGGSNAHHCFGSSVSGAFGLTVNGTASFCRGSRNGGVALQANVAIGCSVIGTGTVSSTNKFLGTP